MIRSCTCVAVSVLLAAPTILADEPAEISASVDTIDSQDWRIQDLDSRFELSESGIRGEVRIGRIDIVAADLTLSDTVIVCRDVALSRQHVRCDDATLDAAFPGIGRHRVAAKFDYVRDSGETHFELLRVPLAGGEVHVIGTTSDAGTVARFSSNDLQLAGLIQIANELGVGPGAIDASGTTALSGSARTTTDGSMLVKLGALLSGASMSNELGTLVTDSLEGELSLNAKQDSQGWLFESFNFAASRGEAYVEPIYANFAEHAVRLSATGVRTADFLSFIVDEFNIDQDSQVTLAGNAILSLATSEEETTQFSGTVEVIDTSIEAVYTGVLRILAAGTVLGDLETAGRLSGVMSVRNNALQVATFEFSDLILDDRKRRFALYGLDGKVAWPGPGTGAAEAGASHLQWDSANAYDISFGGGHIDFRLGGDDFELLHPVRLPTMGGALMINQLVVHDYGTEDPSGLLDAELEPIQLGQLTGAFGWPAFSGALSGRLPLLQYQGNAMTVGGSLTASAFGGDIEVSGLRIVQPFGRVPRLEGSMTLRDLDLERLTETFSFGLIQGRLSGDVTGLFMENWRPVAMDLHLYTPDKDRTPHRISQRAVENLASVGGGGAGVAVALSSGLLRFFEVFAYDRIGLHCILRNGSCAMSGVGPAAAGPLGRGYYIVKGKGIPRIDVVGYRDQVSWPALVRQLSNITRSEAPVVK